MAGASAATRTQAKRHGQRLACSGGLGWATGIWGCGRVLVLVLVLDEVAGVSDERAGVGDGFIAVPAGGVLRVESAGIPRSAHWPQAGTCR